MTPLMCLGPLCPLPRHFSLKTSDFYHVLVVQGLRVAHLCVYPETVLHSVVLNLSGMALSSEEVFCQKTTSEGYRRSCITHGPQGQGRAGRGSTRGSTRGPLPESRLRPGFCKLPNPTEKGQAPREPENKAPL